MDIRILALVFLIGRLIAVSYLISVLRTQIALLRLPIEPEIWDFRKTLHYMTIVLALSNVLPIILDAYSVFKVDDLLAGDRPAALSLAYTTSNVITAIIASLLVHKLYELARNTEEVTDLERKHLQKKIKD